MYAAQFPLHGKEQLPKVPVIFRFEGGKGTPCWFLIDTGAEDTYLAEEFFAFSRVPPYPKEQKGMLGIGGKTKIAGYEGGMISIQTPKYWLKLRLKRVWQVLEPALNTNILGRDFFRAFGGRLTLDFVANEVRLEFADADAAIPLPGQAQRRLDKKP
jgi:hypothetical protein